MRLLASVSCAALFTAVVAAQTPQPAKPSAGSPPQTPAAPQQPIFRTGVELLSVDVTAIDGDGRQVIDLKPADFIIEVDGRPRPVVSAEYVRLVDDTPVVVGAHREVAKPAAAPDDDFFSTNSRAIGRGRTILLLVDSGNIRMGQGRGMMRSAVKFVDNLAPADRVALVVIPGPGALVDFTTDHEKIREGLLATVGLARQFRGRFNISLSEAIATVEHSDIAMRTQMILRECAQAILMGPAEASRCEIDVEQESSEIVAQQRQTTHASLLGMREVLKSLARLEGPKSVILISEGLVLEGLGSDADDIAAVAADVRASLDVMLLDVPAVDAADSTRPTTPKEDRDRQVEGLELIAAQSRGALHRIVASGDQAFVRVMRGLEGHYLLGVEARPSDRDGKRHKIEVKSNRRGVRMYSRRGFLASTSVAASSPAEAVTRALRAPLTMNDVPMRIATWTYKEPGTARVRLLVAADVDRAADQPLQYTAGLLLIDGNNRVVASMAEPRTFKSHDTDPAKAVFAGSLVIEPGTYLLRLAVADSEGRIGSVERKVQAWQLTGAGLNVGDLLIGEAPRDAASTLQPAIEPIVSNGRLAAVMEIYSPNLQGLQNVQATLDVLPADNAKPISSTPMRVGPGHSPEIGSIQTQVNTALLPPGRYLARATVTESGKPRGHIVRPFRVAAAAPAAADATAALAAPALPVDLSTALLADLPVFDKQALLAPDVLRSVFAAAEKSRPAGAKSALDMARAGKMAPAALEALGAGDQVLAAFLRGVDFYAQGNTERAQQQLQLAMQQDPKFAAARLYLGAALALGNRHKEAASLLQSVSSDVAGAAPVPWLAGVSWLKAGDASLAIASLEKAAAAAPADVSTARALGLAYVIGNRAPEALPWLARYLEAKPADQAALLAGVYATYATHAASPRQETLAADRTRAQAWARAYAASKGSMQGLAQAWLTHLESLK